MPIGRTVGSWYIALALFLSYGLAPANAAEDVQLKTKDGVLLYAKYYASKAGEQAVPVILLHGWQGQGGQLTALAAHLNSAKGGNHAVILPDLRGHGRSTQREDTDQPAMRSDRMTVEDFEAIVQYDMEAVKRYLLTEHNQRRLNIDMLTVVGSEMGAVVAAYWTASDWDWPLLAGRRQGQDVKAMILVSPPTGFRKVKLQTPLGHEAFQQSVSTLVMHGKTGARAPQCARRAHATLKRNRRAEMGLEILALPTSLQGHDLFKEKPLAAAGEIARFIKSEVVDFAEDFAWEPRGNEESDS